MKMTNHTTLFSQNRKTARLALLAAFALITFVCAATPGAAQDNETVQPASALPNLVGTWTAGIELNGGCGIGSKLVTFTLNSRGEGPASYKANTAECGKSSGTGTMQITSMNADGSGTATLSINFVGHFNIQVSQNGQVMSLVEIEDTINYDVGVAVKQ
jgi:hypothetical protein